MALRCRHSCRLTELSFSCSFLGMRHYFTWLTPALVALALSAPAHADPLNDPNLTNAERTFVHDAYAVGVYSRTGDDSAIVTTGWQICGMLSHGLSSDQVADTIFYNSTNAASGGVTLGQARAVVTYARQDLCPS